MFNRKASISMPLALTAILALVAAIVCLSVFADFNGNVSSKSEDLNYVLVQTGLYEDYVLLTAEAFADQVIDFDAVDLKGEFKERVSGVDFRNENAGNFFGKVRNGDFEFVETNEDDYVYVLRIEGLFVEFENKGNKVRRDFDLEIMFDGAGEVVGREVKYLE